MKIGLVLEGGALRGMFTAGVLDFFLENNLRFPYVVGVSAGGGNAMNYAARQIGRSKEVINPPKKERYYGPSEIRHSGRVINLDKMFYDFVYEKYPYDFDEFFSGHTFCEFVVTNCETGQPEYLSETGNRDRLLQIGKATCSLPGICEPVAIDGKEYLDGSLTDSLPIKHAMDAGCDKIVMVMTKPVEMLPTDYGKYKWLLRKVFGKKYPRLVESTLHRAETYRKEAQLLSQMQKDGKAFIIRPDGMGVGHFEGNADKLDAFYRHGYDIAGAGYTKLQEFLKE